MKRNFKHVSILDGGVHGALETLTSHLRQQNTASNTNSSSLDDSILSSDSSISDSRTAWISIKRKLSGLLVDCNPQMIEHLVLRTHDLTVQADQSSSSRSRTSSFGIDGSTHSVSSTTSNTGSTSGSSSQNNNRRSSLLKVARSTVSQAASLMTSSSSSLSSNKADNLDSQTHGGHISKDNDSTNGENYGTDEHNPALSDLLSTYSDTSSATGSETTSSTFSALASTMGSGVMSGMRRASTSGWGISMFSSNTSKIDSNTGNTATSNNDSTKLSTPVFVIDDEEESPPTSPISNSIASAAVANASAVISKKPLRTDAEKQLALALHKLNGLRRGDYITISKEHLPGSTLFPANKYSIIYDSSTSSGTPNVKLEPRFLVVSRERFLSLRVKPSNETKIQNNDKYGADDGHQEGGTTTGMTVGATATVMLNIHLTQLLRMSFKKKEPQLISFIYASDGTPATMDLDDDDDDSTENERIQKYRVAKRNELIETLQNKMKRFK